MTVHVERGVETDAEIIAQFAAQVAKACRTLPPGPEVERLRNFCGRIWELLHTPTYAALERQWLTAGSQHGDLTRFYAEKVYAAIHAMLVEIIEHGIVAGELRTADARAAARVILSALVTQAFWCNHPDAFGPAVAGNCHRAVADTLSLVLGGLQPSAPGSPTSTAGHS
jgi:hypothetical protein